MAIDNGRGIVKKKRKWTFSDLRLNYLWHQGLVQAQQAFEDIKRVIFVNINTIIWWY